MNLIRSSRTMLLVCVAILWLGGCAGTVTVAKKYAMPELPYVEWRVSECVSTDRVIDQIEFVNLSEWILNAEYTIKKYERQVDMFNDSD